MINSINVSTQTVNNTQPVIFSSSNVRTRSCKSCCGGWLSHTDNSGLFTITEPGIYEVSFNADVAQPTTAGAITLDIAQGGTTIPGGRMITTPTVINAFFNVSSSVLVKVNCRETAAISVINNSGTDITAQEASLTIKRLC